ncbi:DUF2238 domain-containing protein [bacterium]|nr:DUF2238 domain-containing protein [candidate division CSSED10-310 bacterium]
MKRLKRMYHWVLSTAVLAAATIYYLIQRNPEFLIYAATLIVLIGLLAWADRSLHFMNSAKWGFLVWMIMHMAGGSVYIGKTRLYDLILIPLVGPPYQIFKYDQFVHIFCYVVMTGLMFSVLKTITKPQSNRLMFCLILVLASSSIGALNEIIEFSAVVFFGSPGVGGYHNTCLDLVGNLLGSIISAGILYRSNT